MPESAQQSARLYLVTPGLLDLSAFRARLEEALEAGDVAAVLIADIEEEHEMAAAAEALVPVIQSHGAAALLENHVRIAARTGADGVHVSGGLGDLKNAVERLKPRMIVGAGAVMNRHAAMQAGEAGADYVFFGKPHGDIRPQAHHKNLDLAEWWSEIVEVPAVVMAGSAVESVTDTAATGADFIALHEACWSHPDGPGAAVREALDLISRAGE
ncbi:MAG TPA: thiamine phosphate synthase [Afifellaceae bacterium]|nr:thiamine phosphate synthase [Afifellaceae bacterium]